MYTNTMIAAGLMAMVFSIPANTNLSGRIVQVSGQESTSVWSLNTEEFSVATTSLPVGMTVTKDTNKILFRMAANKPVGMVTFQVLVTTYEPPLDNWKGPPMEITHTIPIEWHVIDTGANPFLNGPGDVVAQPVSS